MVAVAQQSQVAAAILVRDYHDDLRLVTVDGPPVGPGHGGLSGRAARPRWPCHSATVTALPVPRPLSEAADFSAGTTCWESAGRCAATVTDTVTVRPPSLSRLPGPRRRGPGLPGARLQ